MSRHVQKKKHDDIEGFPELFVHSKKIHEGLKNFNVVCSSSGVVPGPITEFALMLFRTAMNYRWEQGAPCVVKKDGINVFDMSRVKALQ